MHKHKSVQLPVHHRRLIRFKQLALNFGQTVRARYWFPHVPLALALVCAGLYLLWTVFELQGRTLISDFPWHILDFRPSSMPNALIGVGMVIMSIGLLLRSRVAWIVALVLTASTVLSAVIVGHGHERFLVYYDAVLLVSLMVSYRWFSQSSLAAGTLFAIASAMMLMIYAVFGSLYLGTQFSPPIKDLVTAFYFAVVTMGTVGYGDITPKTPDARLFIVSVIILGITVFATSVTAVAAPMIARLSKRKEKHVKRSDHFIVIGATPLAYNTYREFKKRRQTVTLIMPRAPQSEEIEPDDLIVGDAQSLDVLRQASAAEAQAVLAMRADDSDNAFIVLAVKELKGHAKTVVAINDSKHMDRIKLVQPDIVIAPEVLGGELLAMMLTGETITSDFLVERVLHFGRMAERS
jgi:voltage-gated potassium channel